jgi:nucleoid DNA-binding protein
LFNTKRIHRIEITKKIYKRLNKTIDYKTLYYSIGIIIENIVEDLVNNQIVTVDGFGTLNPYFRCGHLAHNIQTGKVRQLPEIKMVKFIPQECLSLLLKDRCDSFRKKVDKPKSI